MAFTFFFFNFCLLTICEAGVLPLLWIKTGYMVGLAHMTRWGSTKCERSSYFSGDSSQVGKTEIFPWITLSSRAPLSPTCILSMASLQDCFPTGLSEAGPGLERCLVVKTLAVLPKDSGSIPNIHMEDPNLCNSRSRRLAPSSGLHRCTECTWCTNIHADKILIQVFLNTGPFNTNPSEGEKAALIRTKSLIALAVRLGLPVEGNVRSEFLSYLDYHETEFERTGR